MPCAGNEASVDQGRSARRAMLSFNASCSSALNSMTSRR